MWVSNEFGGAPLGDHRLSVRLEKRAARLADGIGQGIARLPVPDLVAVRGLPVTGATGGVGGDPGAYPGAAPGPYAGTYAPPTGGVVYSGGDPAQLGPEAGWYRPAGYGS